MTATILTGILAKLDCGTLPKIGQTGSKAASNIGGIMFRGPSQDTTAQLLAYLSPYLFWMLVTAIGGGIFLLA